MSGYQADKLLREVDQAILDAKWVAVPEFEDHPGTRGFTGVTTGWILTAVCFPIEDQGFPPGSLGYDGVASCFRPAAVVHMTREQAQRAVERANELRDLAGRDPADPAKEGPA